MMIARHKITIQDTAAIVAVLAVAIIFAWQLDVFPAQSGGTQKIFIELDEVLGLLALGFGLLSWSRLKAQRREIGRRIAAEHRARSLAMEDPLTGLPNRRQFDQALAEAFASPPRRGSSHAVFMLDVNGFKKINDVYGHPAGDDVLVEISMRLREAVRDGDLVARLGGDEFAVLATHVTGPETATSIARRIIEAMDQAITIGATDHFVGAAIGISLMPQDGDQLEVVRKADIALYRAKAEGRSALRFFEAEMDAQLRERDGLERELRAAIGAGVIMPHYQPQIDLKTGAIVGFEALARWHHPTLGNIPPTRFIPVADDCGLMSQLADQLLRRACSDAMRWPPQVILSFNVSPTQLRDQTLGSRIMNILAEYGFPPERLEIELTESALVRDMAHAQEVLGALRATGVKIALDDFGTGYSSLYHLRAFKLDKIKIDRSFVDEMVRNPESAAIVRALIGLGAGLNLKVTAEGVETAEQEAALLDQGCTQGQGYLFSAAVSANQAIAMIKQGIG